MTFDRIVALKLCDILFVNVYMSCENGSIEACHILHETLANISDVIENAEARFIVFGGDLNTNLHIDTPHARAINDFCKTYRPGNSVQAHNKARVIEYTFSNEN